MDHDSSEPEDREGEARPTPTTVDPRADAAPAILEEVEEVDAGEALQASAHAVGGGLAPAGMTEPDGLQPSEGPGLKQAVSLSDIIDADSLQRVCLAVARLFGSGLVVFDARGRVLVDVAADHAFCKRVRRHYTEQLGADINPTSAPSCVFDEMVKASRGAVAVGTLSLRCICGMSYRVASIRHQGEVLGRLVYGPYRVGDGGRSVSVDELDWDESLQKAWQLLPCHTEREAVQTVTAINQVLSVIVNTGFARHLTSQIHIAAIQDAYDELTEKNRCLADSVEQLKELDKLKSSFLATVSHELRTPLTSVIGYSEMLLEGLAGGLNDEQRDYVKTIMDKGDQLLQIINGILDISKIQGSGVRLSCAPFDLAEVVADVADSMLPESRKRGLAVVCDAPTSLPSLCGDRGKIRQALLNLLSNAVKFTPSGGTITVSASHLPQGRGACRHPAIELRVADNGIGIPEASRADVFRDFYQLDSSSTREYGGTGLGLSIVSHFVRAHGGTVELSAGEPSVVGAGHGATFTLVIPLKPPNEVLRRQASASTRPVG